VGFITPLISCRFLNNTVLDTINFIFVVLHLVNFYFIVVKVLIFLIANQNRKIDFLTFL